LSFSLSLSPPSLSLCFVVQPLTTSADDAFLSLDVTEKERDRERKQRKREPLCFLSMESEEKARI
jgi:hypothetical protein